MNRSMSVKNYPEHLNPFDENYDGVPEPVNSGQKYNTWSGKKGRQINGTMQRSQKEKPTFLERPWTALNITPKGKLVRRLSFLKSAVERMSFRQKRSHKPEDALPRSNSVHEDMAFRITSPKVKERLRLQAIPALARLEQEEAASTDISSTPESNGCLPTPSPEGVEDVNAIKNPDNSSHKEVTTNQLNAEGVRPKARKKKPPAPPPPVSPSPITKLTNGVEKPADSLSASSSITQDLEKGAENGDIDSLAEFEFDKEKLEQLQHYD